MTRAQKSDVIENRAGIRPNMVSRLAATLRGMILDGHIPVGDKLPSEAELTNRFSVSRTVVREAIAALRSDGLVEARQGAGVFVISARMAATHSFQGLDPNKISTILEILELRVAVETEAAALAAARRSPAQEEAIFEALVAMDHCLAEGKPTTEADFRFHLAIADAANNPRFRELLEMLGRDAIPRRQIHAGPSTGIDASYLAQLQSEHGLIADAIARRDEEAARNAMRAHLTGAQQRYRRSART